MSDEIPSWVSLVREDIQGSEARTSQRIQQVETRVSQAIDRMVSKDALDAVVQHLKSEIQAVADKVRLEQEERRQLEADWKAADQERAAKMRRLWGSLWGGLGTVLLAAATLATAIHH